MHNDGFHFLIATFFANLRSKPFRWQFIIQKDFEESMWWPLSIRWRAIELLWNLPPTNRKLFDKLPKYRVPPNSSKIVRQRILATVEAIAIKLFKPILCSQKKFVKALQLPWLDTHTLRRSFSLREKSSRRTLFHWKCSYWTRISKIIHQEGF